jgi:hypothetical protein
MSMDDWGWPDEGTGVVSSEALPKGTYLATIRSAKWSKKASVPEKWRDLNPQGWRVTLSLCVEVNGVSHYVTAFVPRHWRWLFEDICGALGVPMPSSPDWTPDGWVGRTVEIDTDLWESDTGPREDVKKFRAPPAKPAPRRPNPGAAKVAAARGEPAGGDDDVPF